MYQNILLYYVCGEDCCVLFCVVVYSLCVYYILTCCHMIILVVVLREMPGFEDQNIEVGDCLTTFLAIVIFRKPDLSE